MLLLKIGVGLANATVVSRFTLLHKVIDVTDKREVSTVGGDEDKEEIGESEVAVVTMPVVD
jgi:hypothetical protein